MSNLTLLETIFIWYVIIVNVLGIIGVFLLAKSPNDVGEKFLFIMITIAIPIVLPFVLYYIFERIKGKKRKRDLEKKYDELLNNKGGENDE